LGETLHFFQKLLASTDPNERDAEGGEDDAPVENVTNSGFYPPTSTEISDALAGTVRQSVSIKGKQLLLEAQLGVPGSVKWVFADPKTLEAADTGPLILEFCRQQGYPGLTASALLHSYAVGGPQKHLHVERKYWMTGR